MANSFQFQNQTFHVGDTVDVHLKVTEADKTRNQIFQGIIIGIKGTGQGQSFTVRKIASGSVGVERILPLASPFITKIEGKTLGQVRRAKLYFLRDRIGKRATKVKLKTIASKKSSPKSAQASRSAAPKGRKPSQKAAKK